ncbi:MAG: hypothetical protein ACMZ7B_07950 [Balneola sp.]
MKRANFLIFGILFLSCEYGTISGDIGKSKNFESLGLRMSEDLSISHQMNAYAVNNNLNFSGFEIIGIIDVIQSEDESAFIQIPEFDIQSTFKYTEVIIFLAVYYIDEVEIIESLMALIGTNKGYYSENNFPLNEAMAVIQIATFQDQELTQPSYLYVNYINKQDEFISYEFEGEISFGNEIYSYEFNELGFYGFRRSYNSEISLGFGKGEGQISAKKIEYVLF